MYDLALNLENIDFRDGILEVLRIDNFECLMYLGGYLRFGRRGTFC